MRHAVIALLALVAGQAQAAEHFGVPFRYVNVMAGQTLGEIVAGLYPEAGARRGEIVQSIVRLNPQAFVGGDPDRLIAGVKLVLPRKSDLADAERQPVARVVLSAGRPTAVAGDGSSRALAVESIVFNGDRLLTDRRSRLHLYFVDGARLYLRPCSAFDILDYAYAPGETGRSRMRLLRGGFATVTGSIGRDFRANYALATPMATIGVRGTEYAGQLCASGSECDPCAEAGTSAIVSQLHLAVTEGALAVDTHGERLQLHADEYLLASSDDRPPALLKRDPRRLFAAIRDARTPNDADPDRSWLWWLGGALLLVLAL